MQKDLEEACRDTKGLCGEELQEGYGPLTQSSMPAGVFVSFVSLFFTHQTSADCKVRD